MNTSSSPFTTGQGFFLGLAALSWLAVAFVLTSTHLSTVVGAWLLSHGVELAKFRTARRRLTGDMQRLAETMIPVEQNGPPVQHNVAGQRDVLTGDYIGFCTGCGWRAVYPTVEEMNEGGREHVAVMGKLWTASLD